MEKQLILMRWQETFLTNPGSWRKLRHWPLTKIGDDLPPLADDHRPGEAARHQVDEQGEQHYQSPALLAVLMAHVFSSSQPTAHCPPRDKLVEEVEQPKTSPFPSSPAREAGKCNNQLTANFSHRAFCKWLPFHPGPRLCMT